MLHTVEAILQPNGSLHFLEPPPYSGAASCRVLVTFTETLADSAAGGSDWRKLAGTLKNSPNFQADPLQIQQEMRHEWD